MRYFICVVTTSPRNAAPSSVGLTLLRSPAVEPRPTLVNVVQLKKKAHFTCPWLLPQPTRPWLAFTVEGLQLSLCSGFI